MENKYTEVMSDLKYLKRKLDETTCCSSGNSLENKIVFGSCENLLEALEDLIWKIEHYSKPVIEGTLRMMENEKFGLIDKNGRQITYFGCGDSIECFVEFDAEEKGWLAGRVEHKSSDDHKGYYFYNRDAGFPFLYDGMKARIRTSY